MINVTVTFEGRVSELRLDPQVLRLGPRRNAETLAAEIKQAVNAAIDHLHEIIREDTSGLLGGIETDLEQLTARHQSTMNQLSDALAQAHRRLDDQAEHRPPDRPGSGH
jgi:ABC-type transporter Mla subunit MlaD